MADTFPEPYANAGGDEVTTAPQKGDRSLLAAERGTQQTRRLETDADSNLYVNVAAGTITATIGEVEVKNDTGNPIPVSGTVAVNNFPASVEISNDVGNAVPISAASLPLPTGAATETSLSGVKSDLDKVVGTWAYYAGTSGTVNVTSGQRVLGISAHSTLGGTMTINGGQTITVPANVSLVITPVGNLTAPTVVFTGTDTYFIEVVS